MPQIRQSLEQQVVDLQSQVAFQEDAISNLDAALTEQQQDILLLRRQLELMLQRQQEQAESAAVGNPVQEKPPHY